MAGGVVAFCFLRDARLERFDEPSPRFERVRAISRVALARGRDDAEDGVDGRKGRERATPRRVEAGRNSFRAARAARKWPRARTEVEQAMYRRVEPTCCVCQGLTFTTIFNSNLLGLLVPHAPCCPPSTLLHRILTQSQPSACSSHHSLPSAYKSLLDTSSGPGRSNRRRC